MMCLMLFMRWILDEARAVPKPYIMCAKRRRDLALREPDANLGRRGPTGRDKAFKDRRKAVGQGRPAKFQPLEYELFQYVVDLRRVVAGRISARFLVIIAQDMATSVLHTPQAIGYTSIDIP